MNKAGMMVKEHDKNMNAALDACLQAIESEGLTVDECLARYPEVQHDLAPLLLAARKVAGVRGVVPRSGFQRQSWAALRTKIRQAKAPRPLFSPRRRLAFTFAALGLVLALAVTTSGTIFAAGNALPGEPLYAVEIAVEQAQLRLSPPIKAMQFRLELADRRVWEAERLSGRAEMSAVAEPIAEYTRIVNDITLMIASGAASGDRDLLETVQSTLANQQARLQALQSRLPASQRTNVANAIIAAAAGQTQAEQALNGH